MNDPSAVEELEGTLEGCLKLMGRAAPKAENGIILEQGAPKMPCAHERPTASTHPPSTIPVRLARGKARFSGRVGQAATNLKHGWHVDPLQSTAHQPARKRKHEEVETEVVTEDLEGDTPFCEGSTGDGGCRKETERG